MDHQGPPTSPHPPRAVAERLAVDETYLWPELFTDSATQTASVSRVAARSTPTAPAVGNNTWSQLISGAHEALDLLFYAGTHLFEQRDDRHSCARRPAEGVRCRVPDRRPESATPCGRAPKRRARTGGLEGRIQLHRLYLRDVAGSRVSRSAPMARRSTTRSTGSIEDLLVNAHAYGAPAGLLARSCTCVASQAAGCGTTTCSSFDEVWKHATPRDLTSVSDVGHAGAHGPRGLLPRPQRAEGQQRRPLGHRRRPRRRGPATAHPQDRQRLLGTARAGRWTSGESIADAAVREVAEETGLTVEMTGSVGIYTDPGHVMAYDDGEVRQEFSVCFHARVTRAASRARTAPRPRPSAGSTRRRRRALDPPVYAPPHRRRANSADPSPQIV